MPNVLCCSGLDPTGGAGVQADIEAVSAQGCHALAVVTALTVQDTHNVRASSAVEAGLLRKQLDVLLADCAVNAIKVGLLADQSQLPLLAEVIDRCHQPVVIDPILRAGGGTQLLDAEFAAQMGRWLFPRCTVLTPNAAEARCLTGLSDLDAAAKALLSMGVRHVLITGGDEPGDLVQNCWYSSEGQQRYEFARVAGHFHGAGCTLAATIAARLGLGESVAEALYKAQHYTRRTLQMAVAVGQGRWVPRRVFPAVEGL